MEINLPPNMAIVGSDYFSIMTEMVDEVIENYKKDSTTANSEILNELLAIKMYLSFDKAKKQSVKLERRIIGKVPLLDVEESDSNPPPHHLSEQRKSYYQRHKDLILSELKQYEQGH